MKLSVSFDHPVQANMAMNNFHICLSKEQSAKIHVLFYDVSVFNL